MNMSKKWTQSDIDQLREKGLRKINTKPSMLALGRLKAGTMNKTETAYYGYLKTLRQAGEVLWFAFEPLNLRLADKCFYRVDFLVMTKTGHLECHEVKGFWTDDALVKIKVAAAQFPFRFIAVKFMKGSWELREF